MPGSATVAVTPNAAAVRITVPTFPGSCSASSTRIRLEGPAGADKVHVGIGATASTPCGASVSAALARSASLTTVTGTPRA